MDNLPGSDSNRPNSSPPQPTPAIPPSCRMRRRQGTYPGGPVCEVPQNPSKWGPDRCQWSEDPVLHQPSEDPKRGKPSQKHSCSILACGLCHIQKKRWESHFSSSFPSNSWVLSVPHPLPPSPPLSFRLPCPGGPGPGGIRGTARPSNPRRSAPSAGRSSLTRPVEARGSWRRDDLEGLV